jgi:hypothetical protein
MFEQFRTAALGLAVRLLPGRVAVARAACIALALLALPSLTACNNSLGGFAGSVGNTPPTFPATEYKVLGTLGTPFTLTITDATASWVVPGTVPLNVVIINEVPPLLLVGTKLTNNSNLLSIQALQGGNVRDVSSTSAPFGVISVQVGRPSGGLAPAASPDLRIFVKGPPAERFSTLIEDNNIGFIVSERAPALFLFESPNGSVIGQFMQQQNFGPFSIDMTYNGVLVASVTGGPNVTIKQP